MRRKNPIWTAELVSADLFQSAVSSAYHSGARAWEEKAPETDTDSDDMDAEFMEQYSSALDSQLRGTHMASSFARVGDDSAAAAAGTPSAAAAGASPSDGGAAADGGQQDGQDGEGELQPVDLDLNLVSNMLESFASQQGLPGPASNLAGMLGVPLSQLPGQSKQHR